MLTDIQKQIRDELQTALAFAQSLLTRSRTELQTFQSEIDTYHRPMHQWHPVLLKHHTLLDRQHTSHLRQFHAAESALRLRDSQHAAAKHQSEAPPPPKPPVDQRSPYRQNIEITVVDGKVISKGVPTARHYLENNFFHKASEFIRHYYFPDAEVPDEYASVLENNGNYYGLRKSVFIGYKPEEFRRMCQFELDNNCEHFPEGERLTYYRGPDIIPVPRPGSQDHPKQE